MSSEPKEYASVWYNFITRKGAICFFSIFTNQKFCRIFTLATFESEKVKMAIAIASSFPFFSFLAIFLVFASNFILWESYHLQHNKKYAAKWIQVNYIFSIDIRDEKSTLSQVPYVCQSTV